MGWSPPSPVGLQEHVSREGKQRLIFPSVYLCLCRHVKLGTNEWGKPQTCQVILSTPVHSCARDWLAGCQTHFLFLTDTCLDDIFPLFLELGVTT